MLSGAECSVPGLEPRCTTAFFFLLHAFLVRLALGVLAGFKRRLVRFITGFRYSAGSLALLQSAGVRLPELARLEGREGVW